MAADGHLGFVWGIFGPPQRYLAGFITMQHLVAINAVVSKYESLNFRTFGLKMAIRNFAPPKMGFWRNLTP